MNVKKQKMLSKYHITNTATAGQAETTLAAILDALSATSLLIVRIVSILIIALSPPVIAISLASLVLIIALIVVALIVLNSMEEGFYMQDKT